MTVRVYVEGGGDHNKALRAECRRGFSEFFLKAGLAGRMPSVIACGSRRNAYEQFCLRVRKLGPDEAAVLLVDSENVVAGARWAHVGRRAGDGWVAPAGATENDLHFMVVTMEAWFFADRQALADYYGRGFRADALGPDGPIEATGKAELYHRLAQASAGSKKGAYSKGRHSFSILVEIDPARVRKASPEHCGRLLDWIDGLVRTA